MLVFFGMVLGPMVVAQVLALVYGQQLAQKGDVDPEKAHREAAINATVVLVLLVLVASPSPWYKQPPVKGVYLQVAKNLKPKDKKGNGWLAPQSYANKKEAAAAAKVYATIHKTLLAVVIAGLAGVLGGLGSRVFASQLAGSSTSRYQPPSGPRSPFTGRPY